MRTPAVGNALGAHPRAHRRNVLSLIAAATALLSCSDSASPNLSGTFYGPTVAVAGGTGRAYVTLDRDGTPTDLGLAFSESALTGLPSASTEYVLQLPSTPSGTPFKHATINWQPLGHPPPMVYTVPHFDYATAREYRIALTGFVSR